MTSSPPSAPTASDSPPERSLLRIALVLALPLALLVVGRLTGLHERLSVDGVRAAMHAAGAWGGALFVATFCVGELVHVPGLVFVAVSVLAYGPALGAAAAYLGALVSLSVSFWVVRSIGGRPLSSVTRPIVRRWLAKLTDRPVRTIALLRLVFVLSPPLNYALALSGVRFRQYLVGSALGLLAPTALAVVFFNRIVEWAR